MNKFLLQKDGKSDSSETQKSCGTRGSDVCVSIKMQIVFVSWCLQRTSEYITVSVPHLKENYNYPSQECGY